jgi:hypothetical protein
MESKIAYYKVKKAELTQGNYVKGFNITISMVGAYAQDGKWIKWISLEEFMEILINSEFHETI